MQEVFTNNFLLEAEVVFNFYFCFQLLYFGGQRS